MCWNDWDGNTLSIPVVYINLDRSNERRHHVESSIRPIYKHMQRIPAVDAYSIDKKVWMNDPCIDSKIRLAILHKKPRCDDSDINTLGALGAYWSHRSIWQNMVDQNIGLQMVLEDSATIKTKDIVSKVQSTFQQWKKSAKHLNENTVWTLCGRHITFNETKQKLCSMRHVSMLWGLHGYILSNTAARTLLDYTKVISKHVDHEISMLATLGNIDLVYSHHFINRSTFKTTVNHFPTILTLLRNLIVILIVILFFFLCLIIFMHVRITVKPRNP